MHLRDPRSAPTARWAGIALCALMGSIACGRGEAHADQGLAEESAVKAAYVYNFGKFTEWPSDVWGQSQKLRVCLAGPMDEFARAVEALQAKAPIQGRAVEVASVARPADLAACHMLVLTGRERIAQDWLRTAAGTPVLTVSDAEGFTGAGGIVGLFIDAEKVRFEINLDAAQRGRLKLSSHLLKLARIVKDGARP